MRNLHAYEHELARQLKDALARQSYRDCQYLLGLVRQDVPEWLDQYQYVHGKVRLNCKKAVMLAIATSVLFEYERCVLLQGIPASPVSQARLTDRGYWVNQFLTGGKPAFWKAIKKHHPDHGGSPEVSRAILEAWEVVK